MPLNMNRKVCFSEERRLFSAFALCVLIVSRCSKLFYIILSKYFYFASRSQASPQHSSCKQACLALHSVCTDIASRSQASPQHSSCKQACLALHSVCTDIASRSQASPQHSSCKQACLALHSVCTDIRTEQTTTAK